MTSKSSSPGPNPTITTQPAKQTRSRRAANPKQPPQTAAGRAGSAGGIVLEKEIAKKNAASSKDTTTSTAQTTAPEATTGQPQARRKPRKLNKDPPIASASTSTPTTTATSTSKTQSDSAAAAELEALKSRVRGLEAKVEELYKTGTLEHSNRSPRRRGKGRKNSSQQQVPTVSSINQVPESPRVQEVFDDEGDPEEELVRLEGELEVARQDLEQYRPRTRRRTSQRATADNDDDVEEIPRDAPTPDRHVTLSGSYRIPLPAAVNTEDLKTIQSGVSAAQNVARTFLEQRRAAAALREAQNPQPQSQTQSQQSTRQPKRPTPKSVNSSIQVIPDTQAGEKQSWGDWIGGYSMAITRAVKNIEHEAAVESQVGSGSGRKAGTGSATKGSAGAAKRPGVKTKMSGEQVQGLMG